MTNKLDSVIAIILFIVGGVMAFLILFIGLPLGSLWTDKEATVEKVGNLAFYEVQDYQSFRQDLEGLLEIAVDYHIDFSSNLLQEEKEREVWVKESDRPIVDSLLKVFENRNLLPSNVKYLFGAYPKPFRASDPIKSYRLYPLLLDDKGQASMPKVGFTKVKITNSSYGNKDNKELSIKMNEETTKAFRNFSRKLALTHGALAMVYNDKVYLAPQINTEIINGFANISAGFNEKELQELKCIMDLHLE